MTTKQQSLLSFIKSCRDNHGHTPSLDEMVEAIGAGSRKSVTRIIDSLVEEGYLTRETRQTKTVRLSAEGEKVCSLFEYKKPPVASTNLINLQPKHGQEGVSVSLPVSSNLSHQEQKLDVSGTDGKLDIDTIIETAVTLAISRYFNGTQLEATRQTLKESGAAAIIRNAADRLSESANLKWSVTLVLLTWAFNLVIGDTLIAFCYSIFGCLLINLLEKKL